MTRETFLRLSGLGDPLLGSPRAVTLGYFVMDNADDNDKCLEALQRSFSSIDVEADRIRYIGHIINLVVKALLFSEGVSA